MTRKIVWIAIISMTWIGGAVAATEIRDHAMASGGGTSVGGVLTVNYTIGQTFVGQTTGTTHAIHSGFWSTLGPQVSDVDLEITPDVLLVDRLHQCSPNPFNPSTTIRYDLASGSGHVRLRIFDVRGRLVNTLVDEVQDGGSRSIVWRGKANDGTQVASGIYLYMLETPRNKFTKKMNLVQ